MIIKSINSENHNKFFDDVYLNKLVEISLENLDNNVFLNVITLIKMPELDGIKGIIPQFKLDPDCIDETIYDEILSIVDEIYNNKNSSNLRGTFLELLTFKFINKKFNIVDSNYDCFVKIDDFKSDRTVDVFGLYSNLKGIVCECKLSHNNFKDYHLSNLNNIYNNSNKILFPYVISFSNYDMIMGALYKLVEEDNINLDVHMGNIKVISNTNLEDFFF